MAAVLSENTIIGDTIIIKELCKAMKTSKQETKFYLRAAKHGVIAVETMLEMAIAKVGGLTRSNKNGRDFTDGSDAKKGVVYAHTHGKNGYVDRGVTINNLKNKRGILRIVIADPWTEELYYFRVPRSLYVGKTELNFNFSATEADGKAKTRKHVGGKLTQSWKLWNNYRVNTFKELCA